MYTVLLLKIPLRMMESPTRILVRIDPYQSQLGNAERTECHMANTAQCGVYLAYLEGVRSHPP